VFFFFLNGSQAFKKGQIHQINEEAQ